MSIYQYGFKETDYLSKRDAAMGRAIERIGPLEIELNPDIFSALVESIVWQQLSNKAATTIYGRLLDKIGSPTPESILTTSVDDLRGCGLSIRKAGYVQEIARRLLDGEVDFSNLNSLSNEEVIRSLTTLPGIGPWTAEMLLIFSLGRPDILSWGDLGIRNGLAKLHKKSDLTLTQFQQYAKKYSPYGTVASFYLWQVAADL